MIETTSASEATVGLMLEGLQCLAESQRVLDMAEDTHKRATRLLNCSLAIFLVGFLMLVLVLGIVLIGRAS